MSSSTEKIAKNEYKKKWNSKNPPEWFIDELKTIDKPAQEIFEKYSGIAPDEVIPHIIQVRNRAFDVFPYPCIGLFRFLSMGIRNSPVYSEVLQRLKDGQSFLDIGCCFGQDIRKLVADGAPSDNTYGSDLEMAFMELGYDLFLDRDTLKTKWVAGDILNPEDAGLKQLDGKIDIVHAASFFHLFNWDDQVKIAKRIVTLMKPKAGGLVIGRQMGNEKSGEYSFSKDTQSKTTFRHNVESFKKMWKLVGEETNTDWEVEVSLSDSGLTQKDGFQFHFVVPATKMITFVARRL
ncbi:hypothetical protein K432DRAFT_319175 [Lepidopterella palustris CBS 459.81]|uniref:Methyltransferase domain-containing protein n=1 Tax=Lepidopterella palustris CBS 459.81 TaxID=1314670 RepID=A0A8E2EJB7_9PEZI|nr:hypothetical protein K432DRAFT_319175 [Lepidopterella palustris CBS 459.81]